MPSSSLSTVLKSFPSYAPNGRKDSTPKPEMAEASVPPPGFPATIPSPDSLEELHSVMVRCTRCDLFLSRTQVVPGVGPSGAQLLVVGEGPGASEDAKGEPFVGRSGALLDVMLEAAGLQRKDVFIANVIRCRPPANRCPKPAELRACFGWLGEQIRLIRPMMVLTLGRFALQHFLPNGSVTALQAIVQEVPFPPSMLSVYPLLHPSAILRNPNLRPAYQEQFRQLGRILGARLNC
jgi:uracil-DNA glycosylase